MRAAHRFSRVPSCLAVAALLMVSTCPAARGSVEVPRRVAAAAAPSKSTDRHAAAAREGASSGLGSDGVGGGADRARRGVDSSRSEADFEDRNARPGVNGSAAAGSGDGGGEGGGGVGIERRSSAQQQVRLVLCGMGWVEVDGWGLLSGSWSLLLSLRPMAYRLRF